MEITLEIVYKKIEEVISKLENVELASVIKHESELTNEINAALAKSQMEYPPIYLNRKDKSLNNAYTDLDNIMYYIRPILGKNEISLTQRTLTPPDGRTFIQTRIWHSSGQWLESVDRYKPSDNDLDSYISEMNEIKKCQIMALLNITVNNDEFDDNGYQAMRGEHTKLQQAGNKEFEYDPRRESPETITKEQVKSIQQELNQVPDTEGRFLKALKIRHLADLPATRFDYVFKQALKNKEAFQNQR